jgi:hypothetical protein
VKRGSEWGNTGGARAPLPGGGAGSGGGGGGGGAAVADAKGIARGHRRRPIRHGRGGRTWSSAPVEDFHAMPCSQIRWRRQWGGARRGSEWGAAAGDASSMTGVGD